MQGTIKNRSFMADTTKRSGYMVTLTCPQMISLRNGSVFINYYGQVLASMWHAI